ncbi:MAG: ATP-binding protein [Candidatus Omnitrophica bacterium]|nr:ATP-binding protein [Candidatus Omnitrophota bacterium]
MLNLKELNLIVGNKSFDLLLGEVENIFFDCKRQPYGLKDDKTKLELAKDVVSFANAEGGYIFIGFSTKRSPKHLGDEVDKMRCFERAMVDVKQYENVIKDWIYPELEKVEVNWICVKDKKGIGLIQIPNQKLTRKPFLVKREIIDDKKRSEIIFGLVERRRDVSSPRAIEEIHVLMRDGMNYSNCLENKLDKIEQMLESLTASRLKVRKNEGELQGEITGRIKNILSLEDLAKERTFLLVAYPKKEQCELKTVFSDREGSLKRKLEDPFRLRPGGWNLWMRERAKIIEGKYLRIGFEGLEIIDLYRDGCLIFCTLANDNFLCWASRPNSLCINPIALVESVYHYMHFYGEVMRDFDLAPEEYEVKIILNNMHLDEQKIYLLPGSLRRHVRSSEKKEAPKDNFEKRVYFRKEDYDPAVVAFEVVKEIYLWFGIEDGDEKIPYMKKVNGKRCVDIDQIKEIK